MDWFGIFGTAKITMWLLDNIQQQAIMSSKIVDGTDGGSDAKTHNGSYLKVHAVRNATELAVKGFLAPYPVVNTPPGSN